MSHRQPLNLLPEPEQQLRLGRLRRLMADASLPAILVTDLANIFYLTGRVYNGYIYIPTEGKPVYFVRRPVELEGDGVVYIRKPEQMTESIGLNLPEAVGLELDLLPYSSVMRLRAALGDTIATPNASPVLRAARSVKTPMEQDALRKSGIKQEHVYRLVPKLYREGMRDIELQVEIERALRLEGCLGQFRISGDSMEIYMANILTGRNADNPTPYDFAMGGAGLDPSLPVGADGEIIKDHTTVMVDANGNFTGYMTDMTRTFSLGTIEELAVKAHETSIAICRAISEAARPGAEARELWKIAETMAADAGLTEYFMGHTQKAGFVGHGVGIEINELPVIAPRSRDIIAEGNVIAVEPKFVIPTVGAVGIENTYIVGRDATECITRAPESLTPLV